MITRGYYIGQIIDELTAVSHQVQARAGLQLLDLNRYLEDFFKDILNIVFDYSLINLNEKRSNNPGLDLGDETQGVAYQITSTKSSAKINDTLEAICKHVEQSEKFPKIFVFIIQEKQGSYSLKEEFANPLSFTADQIKDINDLLKKVLSLPIDRLQRLFELITKEVARVKIELEIPDQNGKFKTNIDKYIEEVPRERFEGVLGYIAFQKLQNAEYELTEKKVLKDFNNFIQTLRKLPRITRQFYTFLLTRGEWKDTDKYMNVDYFERVCTFPEKQGELRLLEEHSLCWYREPDEHGQSGTLEIQTVTRANSDAFTYEFLDFIKLKSISLEKVIVALDFSDFK
jgi:hypothetical protein